MRYSHLGRTALAGLGILVLLVSCALAQAHPTNQTQQSDRPVNVVIILADDAGYADFGACAGEDIF